MPSRRHSRQTDSLYRATVTLLQVPRLLTSFLPARTCEPVYRRRSAVRGVRFAGVLRTAHRVPSLHSSPLAWTAAVVRNRRRVLDGLDVEPVGLQRPDRRLAAGARAGNADVDGTHAVLLGPLGAVGRGELGRERRPLARALEPDAAGRGPRQHAPLLVRHRDDGVVEGGLHG